MLESKKEDRYVLKPAKTFKFAQNTCVGQGAANAVLALLP